MKKRALIFLMVLISATAWSQETITLSGGFAFANPEDYDTDATGYRITGTYEIGPLVPKKWVHGLSIGYINTKAAPFVYDDTYDITITSWPMYYAPKILFGNEKIMGFAKGAVGMQFARIQIDGTSYDADDRDWGFYGGLGAGGMLNLSKTVFINVEYEFALMTNTYYKNGLINSVQFGIGFNL